MAHLHEAIRAYQRGFYLRNDYYNGINFAYLLNVRAAAASHQAEAEGPLEETGRLRADAVACFVQATNIRRDVLQICQAVLDSEKLSNHDKYWVLATMAEAHLGVGDEERAKQTLDEAFALAAAPWMKESTEEQVEKLRRLLTDSPLRFIRAERV